MPAHAVYLIYTFLKRAQSWVRIYTSRLGRVLDGVQCYGDPEVCRAAVGFLGRAESRLDIIIAGKPDVDDGLDVRSHPPVAAISAAKVNGEATVSQERLGGGADERSHSTSSQWP